MPETDLCFRILIRDLEANHRVPDDDAAEEIARELGYMGRGVWLWMRRGDVGLIAAVTQPTPGPSSPKSYKTAYIHRYPSWPSGSILESCNISTSTTGCRGWLCITSAHSENGTECWEGRLLPHVREEYVYVYKETTITYLTYSSQGLVFGEAEERRWLCTYIHEPERSPWVGFSLSRSSNFFARIQSTLRFRSLSVEQVSRHGEVGWEFLFTSTDGRAQSFAAGE